MPQAARDGRDPDPETTAGIEDHRHAARDRRTVSVSGLPDGPRPSPRLQVVSPYASSPTGRSARIVRVERRRRPRPPAERLGGRPDRIAMWAVLMALALIVVAAISSHL